MPIGTRVTSAGTVHTSTVSHPSATVDRVSAPTATRTWQVEQVAAVAPSAATFATARPLAVPGRWSGAGADQQALWGRCSGSGAEPYDVRVDHVGVHFACSCPSRLSPCKHAVALLLLWVNGAVAAAEPPAHVSQWIDRQVANGGGRGPAPVPGAPTDTGPGGSPAPTDDLRPATAVAPPEPSSTGDRDERVARMKAGLTELQRWLHDRLRQGLAHPSIASYDTWEQLAARLVDAQVGGLANRVRRIAALAGAGPQWHERILAELGVLGLLADAGLRLPELPGDLADAVAVALGWQVRQAAVLDGVPETDLWLVAGRSDTREDRIEVRRTWLRGHHSGAWAMLLSFAAYGQSLDTSLPVGSAVQADLYRYPGRTRLRALLGPDRLAPAPAGQPTGVTGGVGVAEAAEVIGSAVAGEPWLDRLACTVTATAVQARGQWWLTDERHLLPLDATGEVLATLAACTGEGLLPITCEWTPAGVVPLTAHLADRHVDLGRLADDGFVSAR